MKKPRRNLTEKYGLILCGISEQISVLVKKRTRGLVECFLGETHHPMLYHRNLEILVTSAYLQGVRDAAEAEATRAERENGQISTTESSGAEGAS